jgi:hypothetical protein
MNMENKRISLYYVWMSTEVEWALIIPPQNNKVADCGKTETLKRL